MHSPYYKNSKGKFVKIEHLYTVPITILVDMGRRTTLTMSMDPGRLEKYCDPQDFGFWMALEPLSGALLAFFLVGKSSTDGHTMVVSACKHSRANH